MRYWVLAFFLFACLASPFAGQTDQWQRYKNNDGNFSALMPGEPQDTANGDQSVHASHTIQAVSDSIAYSVVYVITEAEQPVNEATFNVYRDSFIKNLTNCDKVSENPAAPAIKGYVGHLYRFNCQAQQAKVTLVTNLYWGRHYAYAVLGVFATAQSDPPTVGKFLHSFSVLDDSK